MKKWEFVRSAIRSVDDREKAEIRKQVRAWVEGRKQEEAAWLVNG